MTKIYYYAKCGTCRKALKWMDENGYIYEKLSIQEVHPDVEEIKMLHEKSGMPLKKFYNTSGGAYKELGLKDKLATMSEEEQYALLASNGMLVKRPLLVTDKGVYPGFKEDAWEELL